MSNTNTNPMYEVDMVVEQFMRRHSYAIHTADVSMKDMCGEIWEERLKGLLCELKELNELPEYMEPEHFSSTTNDIQVTSFAFAMRKFFEEQVRNKLYNS